MSTKVKNSVGADGPHTLIADKRWVSFCAENAHGHVWADMPKPNFIKAVETELDGIFISRDDLPEVVMEKSGWNLYVGDNLYSASVEAHRELALRHLAASEYLKAHPPGIEQQVEALAPILRDAAPTKTGSATWKYAADQDRWRDAAREVLSTGKVTVTVDD